MTIDLSKIEEAARAAVPGPWEAYVCDGGGFYIEVPHGNDSGGLLVIASRGPHRHVQKMHATATHMANTDPATVLKLCEAVRAAKAWVNSQGAEQMNDNLLKLAESLKDIQP